MDSLRDLFENLGTSVELEEILSTFDQDLRCLISFDALSVLQVHTAGYVPLYAARKREGEIPFFETSTGRAALASAVRECRPVLHTSRNEIVLIFPLRAALPSVAEPTAILSIHRDPTLPFSPADAGLLQVVAPKLAACVDNALHYRRAQQIAEADPATGLANIRSLFHRLDAELARARRAQDHLGILHCATEGLDRSGRFCSPAAARSLFEMVAGALASHCREYDTVARSADDLVLVLPSFRREFLEEKTTAIQAIFADCGATAGFPLYATIGDAFFPEDGLDAEDLLTVAANRLLLNRQNARAAQIINSDP